MCFIKDEKRSRSKFAKGITEAGGINFVGEQTVGNNEARTSRPRINRIATQPPHFTNSFPVDDFERKAKFCFEFVLPLDRHRRWGCNDDEIDPAAQQQFSRDQASFNGLAQANIIRDQQIHAR